MKLLVVVLVATDITNTQVAVAAVILQFPIWLLLLEIQLLMELVLAAQLLVMEEILILMERHFHQLLLVPKEVKHLLLAPAALEERHLLELAQQNILVVTAVGD